MKFSEVLAAYLDARDEYLRVRGHRAYEPGAYHRLMAAADKLDEAYSRRPKKPA